MSYKGSRKVFSQDSRIPQVRIRGHAREAGGAAALRERHALACRGGRHPTPTRTAVSQLAVCVCVCVRRRCDMIGGWKVILNLTGVVCVRQS